MLPYFIHERFYLVAQIVIVRSRRLDVRKRLVHARPGGLAHIAQQERQVLGALELDAPLDLGDDRVRVHCCGALRVARVVLLGADVQLIGIG